MMDKINRMYYKFIIHSKIEGLKRTFKLSVDKNKPRCFVFLAADYGNLGDVAITYVQEMLLAEKFTDYQIVDIPISCTLKALSFVKRLIKTNDIITITGGGNMSDLYFDIELCRLLVVKEFPNNRIIIFPQTVILSNNLEAIRLQSIMTKIYTAHKDLMIFSREKVSYNLMKKLWPSVNIKLVPDVVMTYKPKLPVIDRKGITLCLRKDKEKKRSEKLDSFLRQLKNEYDTIEYDTHIGKRNLSITDRRNELLKIWNQFNKSEWIITDRLHGMIFAFITCTPAIVFSNSNYKIEGCYDWIKECGYIFFFTEEDINECEIKKIMSSNSLIYNYEEISSELKKKILMQL